MVGRREKLTVIQNAQPNNEYWVVLVDDSGVGVPFFPNNWIDEMGQTFRRYHFHQVEIHYYLPMPVI